MMSIQDHIDRLAEEISTVLDLDELEAKIYLNLLRSGPITASALSLELDVDRARAYRTVDRLVSRNIVSTTLTSPKLCIASDPQEALNVALRKKQDEAQRIKKSGEDLIEKINNEMSKNPTSNVPTFRVVQGKTNIYSDIAHLIENSDNTTYIVTTLEDVARMYHSSIPDKIINCEKKGGSVRLLVDMDDYKLISYVKRFNATETKVQKIPSKGRMIVEREKQLIMSDCSASLSSNSESDFSLCTNAPDMVKNIFSFCDNLWKESQFLSGMDIKKFSSITIN